MLQRLLDLLPPPPPDQIETPPPREWAKLAAHLGGVPEEYSIFIRIYGVGTISSLIRLLAPLNCDDYFAWAETRIATERRHIADFWDTDDQGRYPHDFYPNRPGLFPFGFIGDEGTLWWHILPDRRWPIVVTLRDVSRRPERFNTDFWRFLFRAISCQITVAGRIMPDPQKHPPSYGPL